MHQYITGGSALDASVGVSSGKDFTMNAIFCVDRRWGIGRDGHLLFHIKEDMKFFRKMTTGKVVVMGRKTLESLPGGKPLKNRTNIVLSTRGDKAEALAGGYILCHDIDDLFKEIRKHDSRDIYVIGGASVYRELLPYCEKAYVTRVDADGEADVFVPNLDKEPNWVRGANEHKEKDDGYDIEFMTYCNMF